MGVRGFSIDLQTSPYIKRYITQAGQTELFSKVMTEDWGIITEDIRERNVRIAKKYTNKWIVGAHYVEGVLCIAFANDIKKQIIMCTVLEIEDAKEKYDVKVAPITVTITEEELNTTLPKHMHDDLVKRGELVPNEENE